MSELAKHPQIHTQHTFAWELLGEKGVPYLVEQYGCGDDCDDELLNVIAFIFEELRDEAAIAVPRLLSVASDSTQSAKARRASVTALGAFGPAAESAVDDLRALVREDRELFEQVVNQALAGIGGPAATAVLLARLAEEPNIIHFRDLAALGRGVRSAGPDLMEYLDGEDWDARLWAARDFAEENPDFAVEAGMAALRYLVLGYGYEITGADVWAAYSHTMKAAEGQGTAEATRQRIRTLVAGETFGERFVTKILGSELGLS